MADELYDTIEDIVDELSPDEIRELEKLQERELQRKNRNKEFVQMMTRPETIKSDKIATDTEGGETPQGDEPQADEGGETGEDEAKKAENTEGGADKSKFNIPIKEFLKFDKIPTWYNQFIVFSAEVSHDHFSEVNTLKAERTHIYAVVSTRTDLTPEQKEFYNNRYQELEKLIDERIEGRKSLSQQLTASQEIKDMFGDAFQKWLESIDFNFTLTPLQALLLMVFASFVYSGFVVYTTQQQYKK